MKTVGFEATLAEALGKPRADLPLCLVDAGGACLGLVGDTDLRDALMAHVPSSASLADLVDPSTAIGQIEDAHDRFRSSDVDHLVRVDANRRPIEILRRLDFIAEDFVTDTAILMVGGEGKRLRPLTQSTPKPLLPIAGRPILHRIVDHLHTFGITHFVMALGYMAERIEAYFGDGKNFGVSIEYLREDRPLGTAGAIGSTTIPAEKPVLVMNGDILTDVDVGAFLRHHRREKASLSMAARAYQHRVPYGVLRLLDRRVVSLEEKPTHFHWTNAGIYVLSPAARRRIARDTYTDMTVLIDELLKSGEKITAFPIREYWCDIGRPEDYENANRQWDGR